MKVANLIIEGENIRKIIDVLSDSKEEYQVGKSHIYKSEEVIVLMRESYYLRISSTLMSVIIFKFVNENKIEIELVVSGGKNEMALSFGAEKSESRYIVHEIMNVCANNSWVISSVEPEELMESLTKSTLNRLKEKIFNPFHK